MQGQVSLNKIPTKIPEKFPSLGSGENSGEGRGFFCAEPGSGEDLVEPSQVHQGSEKRMFWKRGE